MPIYIRDESVEESWLVARTLTIFYINVLETIVESVGTTDKKLVEISAPHGSPLAESLVSAWGTTSCPAGKKMIFAMIDGEIVAKLA